MPKPYRWRSEPWPWLNGHVVQTIPMWPRASTISRPLICSKAAVIAGVNPRFFGGRWAKDGLGDKPSVRGRDTFPCVHSGESGGRETRVVARVSRRRC